MQEEGKKKLLFIMGVDWNWIYQRPQRIAEYLSNDFDVTVAYPVKIWNRHAPRKKNTRLQYIKIWTFPFQRKSQFIGKVADQYKTMLFKKCHQYAYIYIDYPVFIECIPSDYEGCIIYDCIDDHVHMCPNTYMQTKVEAAEKLLLQRSRVFITSSQELMQKMEKHVLAEKINVIRNGVGFDRIYDVKDACVKEQYHLGYVGTIAEWFDRKLIDTSAKRHLELVYHLIGPCVISHKTKQANVIYEGIVEHTQLYSFVKDYDCLVMPFVVNEMVVSVDPVKLYEYIAFGKCIISIYYEELEYFREYVYFYTTHDEYESLIVDLTGKGFPPKYNSWQQEKFLAENSWDERYKLILKAIKG